MGYVDWQRVKRAMPLLVILTLVLDVFLLRVTEPAPSSEIAFWTGVAVVATFAVVFVVYLGWVALSGAAHAGDRAHDDHRSP